MLNNANVDKFRHSRSAAASAAASDIRDADSEPIPELELRVRPREAGESPDELYRAVALRTKHVIARNCDRAAAKFSAWTS